MTSIILYVISLFRHFSQNHGGYTRYYKLTFRSCVSLLCLPLFCTISLTPVCMYQNFDCFNFSVGSLIPNGKGEIKNAPSLKINRLRNTTFLFRKNPDLINFNSKINIFCKVLLITQEYVYWG